MRQALTFTALQSPQSASVSYVFDHGDGTLDPGPVSNAYYLAPGTYRVVLRWTYAGTSGSVFCGEVTVVPTPGTPTPTPTPAAPVAISCRIEPQRTVAVNEVLTYTALQNPSSPAVSYVFDHGDGTLDPGRVSYAYYSAPGSYRVILRWSYQGRNGTIACGTVNVVPSGTTPTPTPTTAPINIGCRIEPDRPVVIGEVLTYTALQDPANVPVQYVFDHGDGTRDPRRVSQAYYRAPGSYSVTLDWATATRSGTTFCGVVTVNRP